MKSISKKTYNYLLHNTEFLSIKTKPSLSTSTGQLDSLRITLNERIKA